MDDQLRNLVDNIPGFVWTMTASGEVEFELSISFKMALSSKRKYPMAEFNSFVAAAKHYIEALGKDPLIHRDVVSAMSGLREFLEIERRRVPGEVLYEADRQECLFFAGYDPHFERDEPPGL